MFIIITIVIFYYQIYQYLPAPICIWGSASASAVASLVWRKRETWRIPLSVDRRWSERIGWSVVYVGFWHFSCLAMESLAIDSQSTVPVNGRAGREISLSKAFLYIRLLKFSPDLVPVPFHSTTFRLQVDPYQYLCMCIYIYIHRYVIHTKGSIWNHPMGHFAQTYKPPGVSLKPGCCNPTGSGRSCSVPWSSS